MATKLLLPSAEYTASGTKALKDAPALGRVELSVAALGEGGKLEATLQRRAMSGGVVAAPPRAAGANAVVTEDSAPVVTRDGWQDAVRFAPVTAARRVTGLLFADDAGKPGDEWRLAYVLEGGGATFSLLSKA